MATKNDLRKIMKQKRGSLSKEELCRESKKVIDNLKKLPEYLAAETILVYVSFGNEIETHDLIKELIKSKKRVLVPKVYGTEMRFHEIDSFEELKPGKFGILEPAGEKIYEPDDGLIVMPGLAFDKNFNRVGYGGGFYDKYINKHQKLVKAAVCFDFQTECDIDADEYDIKPDIIVTESHVYKKDK